MNVVCCYDCKLLVLFAVVFYYMSTSLCYDTMVVDRYDKQGL